MVNPISSSNNIDTVKLFMAQSAFKTDQINQTKKLPEAETLDKSANSVIDDNNIIGDVDVNDVKKFASKMIDDLSDDDIKYGIVYGRSVIADFIA